MKAISSSAFAVSGAAAAVGTAYSAYLTAIGAAATVGLRERVEQRVEPICAMRFRVLIPAHDEELLIKDTVAALRALDYPSALVEIHVVADNCTDRTAAIAEDAGATVHERVAPNNPGKGPALMWLLGELPEGEAGSAIVIVDADTLVEQSLLRSFAAQFEAGATAVQGHYAVRGEGQGGEVDLRSAAFAVRHLVRPAGRVRLGGSSSLYGNGMAFSEEVAREFPWSSHLTEDLEMGLRLLLAGETVAFAPDAVARGEMPDTLDASTSQHERWESGRRSVARKYVPRLLRAAASRQHGKSWAYVDASLDILMPPFGTLAALTTAGTIGAAASGRGRWRTMTVVAGAGALLLQIVHVLHSLRLAGAPASVYRSLARAPLNILWKIRLLARTFRDQPKDWVRTSRNATAPTTEFGSDQLQRTL